MPVTLHELKFVRQYEGEMLRRWFDDAEGFFDLIAWVDDNDVVSGFQLAYNVDGEERAITWLGGCLQPPRRRSRRRLATLQRQLGAG